MSRGFLLLTRRSLVIGARLVVGASASPASVPSTRRVAPKRATAASSVALLKTSQSLTSTS